MPPGKKAARGTPSLFTFFAAKAAKPSSTQPAGKRKLETTDHSGTSTNGGGLVSGKTTNHPKQEERKRNKSGADASTTLATASVAPEHEVRAQGSGLRAQG